MVYLNIHIYIKDRKSSLKPDKALLHEQKKEHELYYLRISCLSCHSEIWSMTLTVRIWRMTHNQTHFTKCLFEQCAGNNSPKEYINIIQNEKLPWIYLIFQKIKVSHNVQTK